jgi:hypothetical protein
MPIAAAVKSNDGVGAESRKFSAPLQFCKWLSCSRGSGRQAMGAFCRRVAEELGANDPDAFALVNSSEDDAGFQVYSDSLKSR